MKDFTRRAFFKYGAVGMAGVATTANFPILGQLPLAAPGSNFFTIGVISDTQNYDDARANLGYTQPFNNGFFQAQTKYLLENKEKLNVRFVTHVGDVVQNGDGSTCDYPTVYDEPQNEEWLNAQKALDILAASGIPFGLVPGNHDYDNMYHAAGTQYPPLVSTPSWWRNYFGSGSKYFHGKPWYGGASDELGYISTGAGGPANFPPAGTVCNRGLSSFQFFQGGGKQFLHISLEMEAGDAAIAWAQKIVNTFRGFPTIVTTHSYISPPAWGDNNPPLDPSDPAQYNASSYLLGSPTGNNGGQDIFNKLIYPNDQIFLVLCGHSWTSTATVLGVPGVSKGENIRIDVNKRGNPVYQVLTDYQGNTTLGSAGGDGWYRFMQFDLESNNIHFYTINAYETLETGKKVLAGQEVKFSDGTSDFNQPKGFSDFSLSIPVQVLKAPSVNMFRAPFGL